MNCKSIGVVLDVFERRLEYGFSLSKKQEDVVLPPQKIDQGWQSWEDGSCLNFQSVGVGLDMFERTCQYGTSLKINGLEQG